MARRGHGKPPVTDIKLCFGGMAAILVTRFPEKEPELWAYQSTIFRVAHNYEGENWVAYDRQYRRDMLSRKDLNWTAPNARLYNEAFTGRAKVVPRCPHCLCGDHSGANCPHNPNPMLVGWLPDPRQAIPIANPAQPFPSARIGIAPAKEVCRNYNDNRCRTPAPAGGCAGRGQPFGRGRLAQGHPYGPGQRR